VYRSESARDLYVLLSACAHPERTSLVRAALAVPGFDWTADQLMNPDEGAYVEARALFRRWHDAWHARGHDAVLAPMLARLAPLLARREDGARRITDLRHLVERLGAARVSAQAPASLLAYLGERVAQDQLAEEEADTIRPEPGEARVKVMTAHKSKGLEFGVVFLPLAWVAPWSDKEAAVVFHDEAGTVRLDLGGDADSARAARREQVADALRVAYVTLTRARHRTYVIVGKLSAKYKGSAAGIVQVLFGDRPNYDHFEAAGYAAALEQRVRAMDAGSALAHRRLPPVAGLKLDPGPPPPLPEAAALSRALPAVQPTWSYSALKRLGEQQGGSEAAPLPGADDELAIGEQAYRGARFGRCFHELMEHVDFQAGGDALDPATVRRAMQRHGLDAGAEPLLKRLLTATLGAELVPGLALRALDPLHCARELPFLLGLDGARVSALAALLARHPEYAASGAALAAEPGRLSGWLRGYLDLVFEAGGRYYVLDYKTDVLAGADAYAPAALEAEVPARGYDLQYLLYSVALRRWLRQRHDDDVDARLGGVVYLFVRGLGDAPGHGLFRKSPDPVLLGELERLLAGDAP
jgi:exodeoxyribonuclease V beta subunit